MFVGRAFELSDGTIVLPCEFCYSPVWPQHVSTHMCAGLRLALLTEMDQMEDD